MMSGKSLTMTLSWRKFYQISFQQSFRQFPSATPVANKRKKCLTPTDVENYVQTQNPAECQENVSFLCFCLSNFDLLWNFCFQFQHPELTQAINRNTRLMERVEASLNSLNTTMKKLSIRNVDESCKTTKALKDVGSCFQAFYDLFSDRPGTLFVD